MRKVLCILICALLLCSLVSPVFADDSSTESSADSSAVTSADSSADTGKTRVSLPVYENNKYGYLNINAVTFVLTGTNAEVTVEYSVDKWIEWLVFFFGKEDLMKRVLAVANYPEIGRDQYVSFKFVDTDMAVFTVSNAVMDYGDGSTYWFYQHEFGTTIPLLTFVTSDESEKVFVNVKRMEKGFGYFQ